jgi:hypothetical protein
MNGPRWLVVIEREQVQLYPKLRASFDRHLVRVIVDRRFGERRQNGAAVESDRRRSDRRQASTPRYGLRLEGRGFQVFEAEGRFPVQCATCGSLVESEMPQFGEPPARLKFAVVHSETQASGTLHAPQVTKTRVKHLAEFEAFTSSGRLLLSCRVPARPRESFALDETL